MNGEQHFDWNLNENEQQMIVGLLLAERERMISNHTWRVESNRYHDIHNSLHHLHAFPCVECGNKNEEQL